jgi:hypothetical protein
MRTAAAFAATASALSVLVGATNARAQEGAAAGASAEAAPAPVEVAPAATAPVVVTRAAPQRDAIKPAPAAIHAPPSGWPKSRVYLGAGGGAVFGRYRDPKLINDNFSGVTTEVHVGVSVNRWLGVGLEFSTFYDEVTRTVAGRYSYDASDRVTTASTLTAGLGSRRQAVDCPTCGPLPGGGIAVQQALHLHTFGPRIDFAPDPSRGIYAVLNSGLSATQDLTDRMGFAVGLRGGYRFALSRQVGFSLEGGTSAQRYSNSIATFGFGGVGLQLRI